MLVRTLRAALDLDGAGADQHALRLGEAAGEDGALAAGQQIEHLDSIPMALLPQGAPEREAQFGQVPPPPTDRPIFGE